MSTAVRLPQQVEKERPLESVKEEDEEQKAVEADAVKPSPQVASADAKAEPRVQEEKAAHAPLGEQPTGEDANKKKEVILRTIAEAEELKKEASIGYGEIKEGEASPQKLQGFREKYTTAAAKLLRNSEFAVGDLVDYPEAQDVVRSCYLNASMMSAKCNDYQSAAVEAEIAIRNTNVKNPQFIKGICRKAIALNGLGMHREALAELDRAPNQDDPGIVRERQRAR